MNRNLTLIPATLAHAHSMRIRPSDLHEIELRAPDILPNTILIASMMASLNASGEAFAALDGNEVVAIGGYSVYKQVACPWLICSPAVERHRKQLMRHSRALLDGLLSDFPDRVIGNHVNRDNRPARAFLQSLGAIIVPTPGRADFDFFFFPQCA